MSTASSAASNVFFGTSDFAAAVLGRLAASGHRPALVVTPPDRRSGRGRKISPPPAARTAGELGIELHQTPSVNEDASRQAIRATGAEVAVVCAFGQLIKAPLLDELPMLNAHPSLLPRWRGAAPVERAIMAGDQRTGVCVMRLTEGLDSGPVALRQEVPIAPTDTYGTLAPRLAELSGSMVVEALDLHGEGSLEARFVEQEEAGVTYAEKLDPADRRIDPSRPATEELLRIRGLTPHIGAFAVLADDSRLGIRAVAACEGGPPAGGFEAVEGELLLGCSGGSIRVEELQSPGKRWTSAAEYLRGRGVPGPLGGPD